MRYNTQTAPENRQEFDLQTGHALLDSPQSKYTSTRRLKNHPSHSASSTDQFVHRPHVSPCLQPFFPAPVTKPTGFRIMKNVEDVDLCRRELCVSEHTAKPGDAGHDVTTFIDGLLHHCIGGKEGRTFAVALSTWTSARAAAATATITYIRGHG